MGDGGYLKETLIISKGADESVNNSIVLQDDNHLILPITAGANWLFEIHLFISMDTGGIRLAVNGPALTSIRLSGVGVEAANVFSSLSVSAYDTVAVATTPAGAVSGMATLYGKVYVSSGGNFGLRWAQNVAVANNTTIQSGSWMKIVRI